MLLPLLSPVEAPPKYDATDVKIPQHDVDLGHFQVFPKGGHWLLHVPFFLQWRLPQNMGYHIMMSLPYSPQRCWQLYAHPLLFLVEASWKHDVSDVKISHHDVISARHWWFHAPHSCHQHVFLQGLLRSDCLTLCNLLFHSIVPGRCPSSFTLVAFLGICLKHLHHMTSHHISCAGHFVEIVLGTGDPHGKRPFL